MSDSTAGPPSGGPGAGSNGGPPPVLIAALGAAALIAVGVIAAFASLGGGGEEPVPERTAVTSSSKPRLLLTVTVGGDGIGGVQIAPSDVSCNRSCEYKFTAGARVTATAEPTEGSTFQGWGDACSGTDECSFVMDRPRTLSATFAAQPVPTTDCDDAIAAAGDPDCTPGDTTTTPAEPVEPGPECVDGRDNDDDGLTDSEQDPDCDVTGTETGTNAPLSSTPQATAPPADECTDGRDNDGDGLTDRAQDPDCEKGRSESGG